MAGGKDREFLHRVAIPPPKPFLESLGATFKETFFPDDPFHRFKGQPPRKRLLLGLQYFIPILEWAPHYTFDSFKADLVAGITIASLAIPQGISYAKLANLPPIIGLCKVSWTPLIYAMLGSSRDLAVGTVAVPSLLIASMLGKEVSPIQNTKDYVSLVLTSTFFAGIFQFALGFLRSALIELKLYVCVCRLGFIVDFLSHATIVGFMGGAATVVCLQQLKGMLGLSHFTNSTDLVSVICSVASQVHSWKWESALLGGCFLFFLLLTRYFEGVAVGRSFAIFKNYHIDGNKEMIAFGFMNLVGSCTSCYLTSGPFSRSAVNFNAGCKSAVSNIVMAVGVMITLFLLTPLFYHTPLVVLSSIIMTAMLGLIDYQAAIHLWQIDKFDFLVCLVSFVGVVFGSVETGLIVDLLYRSHCPC